MRDPVKLPVAEVGGDQDDAFAPPSGFFERLRPFELEAVLEVFPRRTAESDHLEEHGAEMPERAFRDGLLLGGALLRAERPVDVLEGDAPVAGVERVDETSERSSDSAPPRTGENARRGSRGAGERVL